MRKFAALIVTAALITGTLGSIEGSAAKNSFTLRFDPAGIKSLKYTNDKYGTDFIRKGRTLGHVVVRYRMIKGKWQEFSTERINPERCQVRVSS